MVALPVLSENAFGIAWDINNSGQVVGMSGSQSVLWHNGELVNLGLLVATSYYSYAVAHTFRGISRAR